MIERGGEWHFGVIHPGLRHPVDLYLIDDDPLLDPDWHDETTEPFAPGEGTHESIYAIAKSVGQNVDAS